MIRKSLSSPGLGKISEGLSRLKWLQHVYVGRMSKDRMIISHIPPKAKSTTTQGIDDAATKKVVLAMFEMIFNQNSANLQNYK